MRRNQLSFTIESFGDQSINNVRHKVDGYIDGNSIFEVLHDELTELHKIYDKDSSFNEFINKVKNYDTQHRFGITQVNLINTVANEIISNTDSM